MKKKNVLVTGGAGFIGCALAQKMADSADRWVVVDVLHPQVHPEQRRPRALPDSVELIVADVTDAEVWDRVLEAVTPDVIIHLAAETGTGQSLFEASRHSQVNVVGTTQMTDALGRHGIRPERIVLSSSRAVYGEGRWQDASGWMVYPGQRSHSMLSAGRWDFESLEALPSAAVDTVPHPTSVYGATKLAQEMILSAWAAAHDVEVITLRLQNVYGVGQSLSNPYTGIVSFFSQRARAGEAIPVYEDGQIIRDFVYIDDVADAFAAAVSLPPGRSGVVFDVGSGVGTSIMTLAETIAAYHRAPAPQVNGAFRDGDVRAARCRIDATVAALDWEPRVSLADGIAALQEWIAEELAEADAA